MPNELVDDLEVKRGRPGFPFFKVGLVLLVLCGLAGSSLNDFARGTQNPLVGISSALLMRVISWGFLLGIAFLPMSAISWLGWQNKRQGLVLPARAILLLSGIPFVLIGSAVLFEVPSSFKADDLARIIGVIGIVLGGAIVLRAWPNFLTMRFISGSNSQLGMAVSAIPITVVIASVFAGAFALQWIGTH